MEGGVTCGFNHANYNYNNLHAKKSKSPLLLFRSTPPFSAINKFLEVAHEKNPPSKNNNNIIDVVSSTTTTTTASTTMDDYGEFSSSSTSNDNTLMHDENNFVEGLFLDGSNNNNESTQNSELSHEVEHRNEEINSLPNNNNNNIKGSKEKKSKGFKDMIKGQWTEEEDRLLKTLVLKYGERKWAMIARSHLVGRAGKQCRERWHNHLRPDIKKDAWDEEEERMLVLAHQQFGNKWAEIARRIPGRSENSIKNHWNATKRRQNCRKKSSKSTKVNDNVDHLSSNPQSQSQPSSILQEYIKARYPSNNKTNHHHPTTTATTTVAVEAVMSQTSTSTNVSVDPPSHIDQYCFDSPTSLTTIVSNPCHEEAIFMQQLFSNENNNNNVINTNNINYNDPKYYYYYHNYGDEIVDSMIMDSLSFDQHNNDHNNNTSNNINNNNNIYSDKLMANQSLDGRSPYDDDHQGGLGGMMVNSQPLDQLDQRSDVMGDEVNNNKQGYLAKKKDMDLFEMILSPNKFLQSSSSNNSSYYYYY